MTELTVTSSAGWAQQVADRLLARVRSRPQLTLCLPTGDTPRPVYARLAAAVDAGDASLAGVRIFLLDEFGGLEPDDPARCTAMLAADLLDHVDVHPDRVHHPDVDGPDRDAAAASYEAAIASAGGIDLALLGLGGNGHVGLNEPGTDPQARTHEAALAASTQEHAVGYGARAQPTWGLTLGIGTLLDVEELWLLVAGEHKREVLAEVVDGEVTPDVPASLLRRHPRFAVLADDAAAAELTPRAPTH